MNHVMYPPARLLYSYGSPLVLCHELVFGYHLGYLGSNLDVSVLVLVVIVFF